MIQANPFVQSIPENSLINTDVTHNKSNQKKLWKSTLSANRFGMKYLRSLNYVRANENFIIVPIVDSMLGQGYALRDKDSYLVKSRFSGEFIISPRSNHITISFFCNGLDSNVTFSRSFKLLLGNFEASILKVINYCVDFDYFKYLSNKEKDIKQSHLQSNLSTSIEQESLNMVRVNRLALKGKTISEYIHQRINRLKNQAKLETNAANKVEIYKQIKSMKNSFDLVISSAIESIINHKPSKFMYKEQFSSLYKAILDLVNNGHNYTIMTYIGLDYRFGVNAKNNSKNHII
ncbi:hypothetical protein [Aliivibrio fischeri]|uniref:hypothetical protein n=1 Tax=Aliivibrio fischeri TaxID=668 RepID=UPI0012D92C24|nr:hypothetical protein [Aliivibrio fischeri]MUJ20359.1 hypothetical protein [Aliivibrio fischeri]